ncbi:TetR/AcrR family transcriptional regulator [Actinomadura sp. 3N508]|uniref:TetR/AcrR family transcriptional regulator n=1 Tax=Actinomadura sp. 3N508 TaxID=3375153 RepID=UPI0037AE1734
MRELPVVGSPPAERADAALNRRRILRAAAEMIATRGPEAVSMDEVARAAGVGVGTVYRRFGDRARLVYAVIDERERDFQTAFIQGPPPLGPGASPSDRLRAFLHALADRTEAQADLLLMAESGPSDARFRDGSYGLYHRHVAMLLDEIRPGADTAYLADALLAPFAANLFLYQRRTRGMPLDRIKTGLDTLTETLLTTPPGTLPTDRPRA